MSGRRRRRRSTSLARAPNALGLFDAGGGSLTAAMPRGGRSGGGAHRNLGQRNDAAALGGLDGARLGSILLQRKMRAGAMVVAEVAVQTTTEGVLIQDDHV